MKILHTSDWHLGQHFMGKTRKNEHDQLIRWLVDLVVSESIELVIIAGDVFDTGAPPSYARELYHLLVVSLFKANCQLLVLAGNHDSVSMLNESKDLLSYMNVRVITAPSERPEGEEVFAVKASDDQVAAIICAVPFLRPKDLYQSFEGESERFKQEKLLSHIQAYYDEQFKRALLLKEQLGLDESVPIVGTGHLTVVGGEATESVRDIYVGSLDNVPGAMFPDFDYLALGHIHRPQKVGREGMMRYSGSPIPLSFDEANHVKRVIVFDTQDLKASIQEFEVPCFQPLMTLRGSFTELAKQLESLHFTDVKPTWLEIKVESLEFGADVQNRINDLLQDKHAELLRLTRLKPVSTLQTDVAMNETLDEMKPDEVFDRLINEVDQLDDEQRRIQAQLFARLMSDMTAQEEGES